MQQSQLDRIEKEDHEKDNPALSKVIERNIICAHQPKSSWRRD